MFGYIITFAAGVGTGAGLLIVNRVSINRAVKAERDHSRHTIDRLKKERDEAAKERSDLIRERDCNAAYYEGRKYPMSEVERFAETLENRRRAVMAGKQEAEKIQ